MKDVWILLFILVADAMRSRLITITKDNNMKWYDDDNILLRDKVI